MIHQCQHTIYLRTLSLVDSTVFQSYAYTVYRFLSLCACSLINVLNNTFLWIIQYVLLRFLHQIYQSLSAPMPVLLLYFVRPGFCYFLFTRQYCLVHSLELMLHYLLHQYFMCLLQLLLGYLYILLWAIPFPFQQMLIMLGLPTILEGLFHLMWKVLHTTLD